MYLFAYLFVSFKMFSAISAVKSSSMTSSGVFPPRSFVGPGGGMLSSPPSLSLPSSYMHSKFSASPLFLQSCSSSSLTHSSSIIITIIISKFITSYRSYIISVTTFQIATTRLGVFITTISVTITAFLHAFKISCVSTASTILFLSLSLKFFIYYDYNNYYNLTITVISYVEL